MPKLQNDIKMARFDYDFALAGGAIGSIPLVPNVSALTAGMVITDMFIFIEEPITSAGTPSLTLGNTDVDGFFADFFALAGVAGKVIRIGEVAGALMYDDTNDHLLAYSVAADVLLNLAIGTAAVTGGKMQIYVEFFAPV